MNIDTHVRLRVTSQLLKSYWYSTFHIVLNYKFGLSFPNKDFSDTLHVRVSTDCLSLLAFKREQLATVKKKDKFPIQPLELDYDKDVKLAIAGAGGPRRVTRPHRVPAGVRARAGVVYHAVGDFRVHASTGVAIGTSRGPRQHPCLQHWPLQRHQLRCHRWFRGHIGGPR
jgi:hypothetical protein